MHLLDETRELQDLDEALPRLPLAACSALPGAVASGLANSIATATFNMAIIPPRSAIHHDGHRRSVGEVHVGVVQ